MIDNRRFISLVPIGTATFLALFLGACSSERDRQEPPISKASSKSETTESPNAASVEKMVFEGPGQKLERVFGEWKIASAPRYFGPDNLFDLINGGAEIYAEFGLVKMVTADYRAAARKTQTITLEIYDMGSVSGAFGRAARFLEGLADPSGSGNGLPPALSATGILGMGDLIFWKDRFLVHLTLLEEDPSADVEAIGKAGNELLPPIAQAVAARIEGAGKTPAIFDQFPSADRVARSEAWYPGRLLGIEGLGAGFTARYTSGQIEWTAFISEPFADEKSAEAAWKSVRSSAADGRRIASRASGKRVVGLIQEGESRLDDAAAEKFTTELEQGLSR